MRASASPRILIRRSLVVATIIALAAPATAAAQSPSETPTLGTARGFERSMCGDGSVLVGMSVAVESRGYVSNVAAICRDAGGAETTANGIGLEFGFGRFDSRCADDDVANGIAGRAGDILDAVGVGCEASDGPLIGGGGGELRTGLDCAEGSRLAGLWGTYVNYFGREVVSSLTGVCQAGARVYAFEGFFDPVSSEQVNAARAGQSVPLSYRLTDHDGAHVSDPASFVGLSSRPTNASCAADAPMEPVDERAAGESSLQYLGDGMWQFNWKTAKEYAGQCRTVVLTLADGTSHTAAFQFS